MKKAVRYPPFCCCFCELGQRPNSDQTPSLNFEDSSFNLCVKTHWTVPSLFLSLRACKWITRRHMSGQIGAGAADTHAALWAGTGRHIIKEIPQSSRATTVGSLSARLFSCISFCFHNTLTHTTYSVCMCCLGHLRGQWKLNLLFINSRVGKNYMHPFRQRQFFFQVAKKRTILEGHNVNES